MRSLLLFPLFMFGVGCVETPPPRQLRPSREPVSPVYYKPIKPHPEIRIWHPSGRHLAADYVDRLSLDLMVDIERERHRPKCEQYINKKDVTADSWRWLFPENVYAGLRFNLRPWVFPLPLNEELCKWLFPDVVPPHTSYGLPDDWTGVMVPYGSPDAVWKGVMCPEPKILSDYLRRCQSDTK